MAVIKKALRTVTFLLWVHRFQPCAQKMWASGDRLNENRARRKERVRAMLSRRRLDKLNWKWREGVIETGGEVAEAVVLTGDDAERHLAPQPCPLFSSVAVSQ